MKRRRRDQQSTTELESRVAVALASGSRWRTQRDRLALALGATTEGVVVVDGDGVEVFRNAAAARFRDARHADAVVERTLGQYLERARTGESIDEELRLYGPPSSVLRLRAFPLRDDGALVGAAALVDDVSELDRVDHVRRDFVANVSHELKTPIGALELLAETLAAETDPEVARPLAEQLAKEAERLARIVDDLLDLSLIEIDEAPVRETVSIDELVEDAVDRVRPAAAAAGIGLLVDVGAGPGTVSCDRRQVVGAVTNLLDNAVKYSERGSTIDVATSLGNRKVAVTVIDRGIGIPRGDLERVFERFYRVDQARSRATGGTGLGLSIVRRVAHAHGGDVTVESVEGQGSTFRLTLPRADRGARDDDGHGDAARAVRSPEYGATS